MKFLKKYWYITLLTVGTIALGAMTFITSLRLQQSEPVTPAEPQAATAACTLSFNVGEPDDCRLVFSLAVSPTPTPTPAPGQCGDTCTSNASCDAGMVCSGGTCRNPQCTAEADCLCKTPTPTPSFTPTPTPPPASCNEGCSSNADCDTGLVCSGGACRNPQCTDEADCTCTVATATPTPTSPPASCSDSCSANADCESGLICSGGVCRNPQCTDEADCTCDIATATPTPTPVPLLSCNDSCSSNADCSSELICSGGACRNPQCTDDTDCSCDVAQTPPPPQTTPQVPVAGTGPSALGLAVIVGGMILLLLGLAF